MARGYLGKMLWVDLSKKEFKDEDLDEALCRRFVGGYGIGSRILYDRQKSGVDPLGHDNTFGIVTGIVVTLLTSTGVVAVTASRVTSSGAVSIISV